jgi:YD repeat-containing protein
MKVRTQKRAVVVISCLGFAAAACDSSFSSPAKSEVAARVKPEYDETTGRLTRIAYDSDGDGKPDTWAYMDGTTLVRVEVDEDGDGQIDRWEFHRAPGQAGRAGQVGQAGFVSPLETIEHIERATRHDGTVSRWEYFEHGQLTRVEEDIDGDGKVDKWETYAAGTLASMALDTTGRGTPDRRLIYKPDGTLERIEQVRDRD